ncbi:zinc-binding dehydrogenase [Prescottella agglutinans]|uniref:Zinc-binding alcohol dehydrogenase/oxidoreductase n=1 Tax=Prescottella agglutinans TaxID=1644129 RepID=A0ABT6MEE0_9NOCA|nr:zinc-binding dehydrogenase [Prescottella agglutinans]MDH6282694.1 zinc-binding alcohol dehydrogenase/oxidoreductase [Prescottella agglutinans]
MIAATHAGPPGVAGMGVTELPTPSPAAGEVRVAVTAAGLNRHELFLIDRRDENSAPLVIGADGVGTIDAVGAGVDSGLRGRSVLINPCLGWPHTDEVPEVPEILGGPRPGTFAEFVCVPERNVHPVPAHLSVHEAAALGLAGLTAYRGLFSRARLCAGEHVVITGISGGVAPIALAMAVAAGAEVTVTSRSRDAADRALQLGAAHAVVGSERFDSALTRPADVVFDSVGAAAFAAAVRALRPGGRLIAFGATTGADVPMSLREIFFRQIEIIGTSMGSEEEFADMLDFVVRHSIRPVVDSVRPLTDVPSALAEMADAGGFGKIVFSTERKIDS